FSGIVTFKSARELLEIARDVPAERILIETDSPYLAPVPKRGKKNQPAFVRHTAEKVAEVRGEELEEFAEHVWANAARIFGWD
ncbi:MAG: TatD family hydrolase, partial [Myxococcota bacterium]